MDWTTIASTISYDDVITFMGAVVTATFAVHVALKGVGLAKSALTRG